MTNFILGVLVGIAGIMAYKIRVEVIQGVDIKAAVPEETYTEAFDLVYDFFRELEDEDWGDQDGG